MHIKSDKDFSAGLAETALCKLIRDSDIEVTLNEDGSMPFEKFHEMLLVSGPVPSNSTVSTFFVKDINGKTLTLNFSPTAFIREVKKEVSQRTHVPEHVLVLVYAGKVLEDEKTLDVYGIRPESTLHLLVRMPGGKMFHLCADDMAPEWDYDFTNKVDTKTYYRGGEVYHRPCGWKRLAIKVLNRYDDNTWLGVQGNRTWSSNGEWPVSYHGTGYHQGMSIATEGFNLTKHKRFSYGHGVYSSPDITTAFQYASEFYYEGEMYKVVIQNRVNPATLQRNGNIWVSPTSDDVRPYGMCIRKCAV
ncbi:hypothetical protein HDV00_004895 [Rhizophlyctis rosea]|nr:hypothetical protein HDV00_004895 [Rhizophlyctis rosea]